MDEWNQRKKVKRDGKRGLDHGTRMMFLCWGSPKMDFFRIGLCVLFFYTLLYGKPLAFLNAALKIVVFCIKMIMNVFVFFFALNLSFFFFSSPPFDYFSCLLIIISYRSFFEQIQWFVLSSISIHDLFLLVGFSNLCTPLSPYTHDCSTHLL